MNQFNTIESLAVHLRQELQDTTNKKGKKTILLFAYNNTGKTRLSMAFKNLGKSLPTDMMTEDSFSILTESGNPMVTEQTGDTLYFNAFTEDLFNWDNDLDGDNERILRINSNSTFLTGLKTLEMDNRIRPFLNRYADFDFRIDTDNWLVRFSRAIHTEHSSETFENIKISRGEENIFIWCFFLAVMQLAMDKDIEAYSWVKYVYIDDPISSLDENNAVAVAHHLAQLLKEKSNPLKTVISSHHTLFFNVLYNEFEREKDKKVYFLNKNKATQSYTIKETGDTPFFYHVAILAELHVAAQTGNLYTYHFNMLRIMLEKTASFHGYKKFDNCIKKGKDDPEGLLHARYINLLSHGNYSLYEPKEMLQENKDIFRRILNDFLDNYNFNTSLFSELVEMQDEATK